MDSNFSEAARNTLAGFLDFLFRLGDQINSAETQSHLNSTLDFVRQGFDQVNSLEGLIIAAIAAVAMPSWGRLVPTALFATVAHIILGVMVPIFADGAGFRMPKVMEEAFWSSSVTLFVGYLIVISVFFVIKRLILRAQPQHAHG
jgi:hypothetical protein